MVVRSGGRRSPGARSGIWFIAGVVMMGALVVSVGQSGCSVDMAGLGSSLDDGGALGVGDVRAGSGGQTSDAAVTGTGGNPGSGGIASTGGVAPSGGSSGGKIGGSGGSSATGGKVGTGGAATGGVMATGGDTPGTGGVTASGGVVGGGGQMNTGGAGASGGSAGGSVMSVGGAGGRATGGRGGGAGGKGGGGGAAVTCGPSTCADGCCMGTTCVRNTTNDRCGMGGAACAACGKCFKCSAAGSCDLDPASIWNVVCGSATIDATMANGQEWDQGVGPGGLGGPGSSNNGGLPDPVCQYLTGATVQKQTSTLSDTLMPAWNAVISPAATSAKTLMSSTSRWSVKIIDDDTTG
ncbi:MAG TPA: hypothetical protein VHU40_11965, partial [Polyangia bacterium]|nr:hypothetical protein [Polyangia bacterium]